jgi:hypothetical protein
MLHLLNLICLLLNITELWNILSQIFLQALLLQLICSFLLVKVKNHFHWVRLVLGRVCRELLGSYVQLLLVVQMLVSKCSLHQLIYFIICLFNSLSKNFFNLAFLLNLLSYEIVWNYLLLVPLRRWSLISRTFILRISHLKFAALLHELIILPSILLWGLD